MRLLVCLAMLSAASSASAAIIERIVGPGDPVPGIVGATFVHTGEPFFDGQGGIRFFGSITGPGITGHNASGTWYERDGIAQPLIRQADPVPGAMDGATIKSHLWASDSDDGALVTAWLTGPTVDATNDRAILDQSTSRPRTIVRTGQAAPGMPAGTRFHVVGPGSNNRTAKNTVFLARLTGPGINVENDQSIWVEEENGLRLVARHGDVAPGSNGRFRDFNNAERDDQGRIVFNAYVEFPENDWSENRSYIERNGQLEELSRTGMQVPGLPAGVTIDSDHFPYTTFSGHVVIGAELSGPGVHQGNDFAVFGDNGSGLTLLAREGESLPGAQGAIWSTNVGLDVWRTGYLDVRLENGETWELTTTGWQRRNDPRRDELAPGLDSPIRRLEGVMTNSLGRRVYELQLESDRDDPHMSGIWMKDENGILQPVIRKGDLVETELGVFEPLALNANSLVGFNDSGDVLFSFRDSIYVARANPVPEPATWILMMIEAIAVASWRLGKRTSRAT